HAHPGVLWGQSHRLGYRDSDNQRVGSQRTDIGTASLILQPSYLVTIDEFAGMFVEPYALFEYGYDFEITKIQNATNDRDAFRIGGGFNFYGADGLSAAAEATRMLGREDQDETTARATVRVDF
ncbi:MAG: hypothetical protein AAF684_11520, partial [Pseudomonadota bacterium]